MINAYAHAENQYTLGLGYQYGGVAGVQIAHLDDQNKYFASIGLIGVALGVQRVFDTERKQSFGGVIGQEVFTSEDGFALLTYNYHKSGFDKAGLVIGLSAGVRKQDSASFFANLNDSKRYAVAMINVGYKF
jgi:hypothetical protein